MSNFEPSAEKLYSSMVTGWRAPGSNATVQTTMQRRTAGEIMMATGRVSWGAPNLPPGGHRGRSRRSAFEAVAVVVLERLEGVLDVVRHDAFVRTALVRRGGIDERSLRIVQVPGRDVDAQRDVQALALLHRHRRHQAGLLTL